MAAKGIKILSLDAKDIFIANNYVNQNDKIPRGYGIRYLSGDKKDCMNTYKFTNTLDESLDLMKIREVYKKVYRNSNFSFTDENQEYTHRIISLTFKYSNKEYNQLRKDTYVKFGYNIQNIEFEDHVCLCGGDLIAIETGMEVKNPLPAELLTKYFSYENGVYHAKTNIKTLHTVQQLRSILYQNGFYCDGIKYVRYKRSGGSARTGKCLFIDEKLYKRMMKWSMCGLKIKEGQEVDLAGLEAYLALPLSSIIDTLEIKPENILIIQDYESVFREKAVETRLENGSLKTDEQEVAIRNSIWDGQSLLDVSCFRKYPGRSMLLLRNKFFKSACFNCNILRWFQDHDITDVSQLSGFTLAGSITDIKLITTPSNIKYLKFGSAQLWLKQIESTFGIVKHEKSTHFFDGRMVQTHYQLLNTLQLTEEETRRFLQPSLEYLRLLKTEPAVLRYHIKYPEDRMLEAVPLATKNDIVYHLLGLNQGFANTRLYYDFKNDLTKAFVKNLRCGHVLVNGNYSVLFGNPAEMLMQAVGIFHGETRIGTGNIHSKRFAYNQLLLGSRSPHVTIGNIWLPYNTANEEIDTYFNLSDEVVCINSINESILDRLSGSDFDSDTALLTDNQLLIAAAKRNYSLFKVPVNNVPAIKKKRSYTNAEKADLDANTSDNKIGDIINLSQELNTLLWDKMNRGAAYMDIQDLYYDICQLDILSGIEIDKAKKEYTINSFQEMQKIKMKWSRKDADERMIKPNFFSHLAKTKGYYNTDKKNYLRQNTAMDYLQKVINQFQAGFRGTNKGLAFCKFSDILNKEDYNIHNVYYEQVDRVIRLTQDCSAQIKAIYADDSLEPSKRFLLASEKRQECWQTIGGFKFNRNTMLYLLMLLDCDKYKKLSRNILNILFGCPNTSFFDVIISSREHIPILMESTEGDMDIFGLKFQKYMAD